MAPRSPRSRTGGAGSLGLALHLLAAAALAGCGATGDVFPAGDPTTAAAAVGDTPTLAQHLDQESVRTGATPRAEMLEHGRLLFSASFNTLDGAGRPESTGTGAPRPRREGLEAHNRISGPDASSCAGCHNLPRAGGGGDNVANVFVLGQRLPFATFDGGPGDGGQTHTLATVGNERNTLGMFGAGFVELLAREMTGALHAQRDAARASARAFAQDVRVALAAKGVAFGTLTARPDGSLDTSAVVGVDADLVVRPFHQKGVVVSLREFTNNAMNHHHGLQAVERFGPGTDPDADGHVDELSVGDITAATLHQALLPVPGRVLPPDAAGRAAVARGEARFADLGCAVCHVPALRLEATLFSEPNPYNPPGNLRPADVPAPCVVDLLGDGPGPHLAPEPDGSVLVPLYSDLKRHDMGPGLDNEALVQGGVPTRMWLTKKLWGFASEPPYLHHGRASLISEAILAHDGEGRASRDAFALLTPAEQADVVSFLDTLRTLPEDAASLTATAPEVHPPGDRPAVVQHTAQAEVDAGLLTPLALFERGRALFQAPFNTLDGAGRPETTGTGAVRPRRVGLERMNRISGPDADACAGCHNLPRAGGGGDAVANVFVLGQRFPFVNFDGGAGDGGELHTLSGVANERLTPGMFGSGWIELLAREMSADLAALRAEALAEARASGRDAVRALVAKGVPFGSLTARPDGSLDTSGVRGVSTDLVVRPWHQKGAVVSLRVFTNNALNHHHGIQASERFGAGLDPDADGRADEATAGDVTALTVYQALLPVPGRVLPADPAARAAVDRGEALFAGAGCAVCHVPYLEVLEPLFREPGPHNPPGNLGPADVPRTLALDLTADGPLPRLAREPSGRVRVPAYTDLKRHDLGPALAHEALVQEGIPREQWLTKRLWGFANEPPFLHHGRVSLMHDAIRLHGGEAQAARDAYDALPAEDQRAVVMFLKTLQVLPEDATGTVLTR